MTNDTLKTIGRHKHSILLAVAILALASYIVPFDNIYDLADAAKKGGKKKAAKKKKK